MSGAGQAGGTGSAGREGAGASPRVELPGFAGSLAELLAVMAAGEVDPAAVPVAEVGRQVVESLPAGGAEPAEAELEAVSGALVLLARVLAVKARALAPGGAVNLAEEAEEEAGDGALWRAGEADPGAEAEPDLEELAERVASYRVFRQAAEELRRLEVLQSERFPGRAEVPGGASAPLLGLRPEDLVAALAAVWERAPAVATVAREAVTVARRMEEVTCLLAGAAGALSFWDLFPAGASRREVVVTFLALLELMRLRRVRVRQEEGAGDIRVEAWGEGGAGGAGPGRG